MTNITKTSIIATLGPASGDEKIITKLIHAGVRIFRINFSHGEYSSHLNLIEIIKNNDFSIKTIHKYIDHQVVEIKDNQEVPKNAMAILKLFGFDKTFIDECKNNLE